MTYTTLISAPQLQSLMASGRPLMVFDCSFDLGDPALGARQYQEAHIRGAQYADLDHHLSAHASTQQRASGGRHPLPSREHFAAWLSQIGFGNPMQAVVYDRNGANYCGRLWWMLKWAGHEAVAVLDGGLQAWQAAGGAVEHGAEPARPPCSFALGAPLRRLVSVQEVESCLGDSCQTLLDARGAPRYRGEVEPLDPVAGHIPGALNRPFGQNLGPDGHFKSPAQLRAEFTALLGDCPPASVVHQCGSGVSALPNLLAMEVAGLGPTALFAGSWSEWCSDPRRPVERG
ncbi:MAG: sulfurtransferase [Proteobacteria bacterium]|nr:sulfurtransferase [Pseudomonadota bacterium]MBS0493844.1 sulfurtransferase [Pseudomonadota bacterium]